MNGREIWLPIGLSIVYELLRRPALEKLVKICSSVSKVARTRHRRCETFYGPKREKLGMAVDRQDTKDSLPSGLPNFSFFGFAQGLALSTMRATEVRNRRKKDRRAKPKKGIFTGFSNMALSGGLTSGCFESLSLHLSFFLSFSLCLCVSLSLLSLSRHPSLLISRLLFLSSLYLTFARISPLSLFSVHLPVCFLSYPYVFP